MRDSRAERFHVRLTGLLALLLSGPVLLGALGASPAAARQTAPVDIVPPVDAAPDSAPAPAQTNAPATDAAPAPIADTAPPAAAQQTAPVDIVPPVDAAPAAVASPADGTAPPAPTADAASTPAQAAAPSPPPAQTPAPAAPAPPVKAAPAAPQASAPAGNTIQVDTLPPVDASWIGTLSEDKGGFPHAMWNGTARSQVAADLPQLQPVSSPSLQDLTRRLLLTDAAAPPGENAPGDTSLIDLRLDRLSALGAVAPALALLAILPDTMTDESTDRAGIELRFANNDAAGACNDVHAEITHYQGVWWDRALIACQALDGDNAKAALGQSLLADQKTPRDPGFDALIDRLGGRAVRIPPLNDITPMKLALLAAAKQKLPDAALAGADLSALRGWAMNAQVPPEQRLGAAERAALYGAETPDELATLYDGIAAKPADTAAVLKAKKPPDARARAWLYQIAHNADDPAQRRAAISALLADARNRGAFAASAPLLAKAAAGVPIDGTTGDFAADAARVLLAAGSGDQALPWIAAAQSKSLALLARWTAGGPSQPGDTQLLRDALAELAARDPAASPHQADLLNALAPALGAPTLSPATAPAEQAAAKGLGETVLTTLLAVSSGGALTTDPAVLARAVSGLRAAGLDAEARRLAIEAALDAGI